jgi:hypothetical protein
MVQKKEKMRERGREERERERESEMRRLPDPQRNVRSLLSP